jgi:CheY-like chemotaxis protein
MKQKVLVIDDDIPMRSLVQSVLAKKYDVVSVCDGLEACAWLSQGNFPDIIVSDVHMPVMDGIELLKFVRARSQYKDIPVVILSTSEEDQTKAQCFKEGANAYLKKPNELDILTPTITRFLASKNHSKRTS